MEHKEIPSGQMHRPHNWVVADRSALYGLSVTSDDIGKYAWQSNTGHEWVLKTASPLEWEMCGQAAASEVIRGLITQGGDPNSMVLPFTDEDGWLWGGIFVDGSVVTPGFRMQITDDPEYIIIDEDGWLIFDASNIPASEKSDQQWSKKRFLMFGDSITQTGNVDVGDFGLGFRSNWPQFAYSQLQMAEIKNYAKSGASFREYLGQLVWQKISHQINSAATNGEEPDVIVISAGTNDNINNLGDYDTAMGKNDLASLDMALTIEAMRWAFWTIRQSWPAATCFAATPIQRADVESSVRQPLLNAITQMAKRYGFIVIDAHNESGIVKDFEVWNEAGRDLVDGLHPNPSGQKKMANLYSRVIKNFFNH